MAWLEITAWCRVCWWRGSDEWFRENDLVEFKHSKHLTHVAVRYLYRKHRRESSKCKCKKLNFEAGRFTVTARDELKKKSPVSFLFSDEI